MSKKDKKKNKEVIEKAAERLAEIFIQQIEFEKRASGA